MKKLLFVFLLLLFSTVSVQAMEKVKYEDSIISYELKVTDSDFYEIANYL